MRYHDCIKDNLNTKLRLNEIQITPFGGVPLFEFCIRLIADHYANILNEFCEITFSICLSICPIADRKARIVTKLFNGAGQRYKNSDER